MSVPNQTPYNTYTANGLTTVFAYEFYLISASDIQVTINGSVATSGYTVSGVGNTGGGEITFLTAPANGATVIFERVTPTYRLTDYQDNGDLLADTVNKDFDRLWMAIQRAFFELDKTLKVPEVSVGELPSVIARRNSLLGWDDLGRPIPVFTMTETADLAIKLASGEKWFGADLVAGNRYHTVRDIISRFKTYSDYGLVESVDGFDANFYAAVFNDAPNDNALFHPGRLNLSSTLYGTSDKAVLLSLHGNENKSFRSQIVSGDTSVLSNYGMAEDLLIYGGITGKKSTTTTSPIYTQNTIQISDGADTTTLEKGSVIKTSDGYWSKVLSVAGQTVTVTGWYKAGSLGTPSGASAYLNHVDKTYIANYVMWVPSSYTGTKAVGAEWDFMIDNPNVTEKNGLDFVLHGASNYGMDTAFLVRSARKGLGWAAGLSVRDITWAGIAITDGSAGVSATEGSILEGSSNANGIKFMGYNKTNSILWKFPGINTFSAALNPYGYWIQTGKVSASAGNGVALPLTASSFYINNSAAFNLVLPALSLTPGQEIHFDIFGVNSITVTCASSSVNVNNTTSYNYTPTKPYSTAHARWNGTSWYFFA